ncbi:MAG: Lrp/AsnC ligand binding domain-containing protein [Candidatus Hadarchaeales archaeon]
MVQAYVLITVAIGKVKKVADDLKKLPAVKSVHVVTGPYDIVAFVEADDLPTLTGAVVKGIHKVKGVVDTNTCIVVEV